MRFQSVLIPMEIINGGLSIPENYVIHSLRHSCRETVRAVECPFDVVDRLGGLLIAGGGQRYGKGFSLCKLNKWMNII